MNGGNRVTERDVSENQLVDRVPVRYARSGDVNIAYQVTGEGPFDLVRAGDDDDVADAAPGDRGEHVRQEQPLLGRAEPGRLTGREHDRRYDVSTFAFEMTTARVGRSEALPSLPIRSTTSSPLVTLPTIA